MPDFVNMTSAEALRYAKQESGKTAEEIAGACGISTSVVSRYLRLENNYSPSLEILPKLCAAMGNTLRCNRRTCCHRTSRRFNGAEDKTSDVTFQSGA